MEFDIETIDGLTLSVLAQVARYVDEGTYDTPPHYEYEVEDLEVTITDKYGSSVIVPVELLSKNLRDSINNIIDNRVWD